jgi:hypothetical protein
MTTEVYINGQLIDLDDEEIVTASYGNVSFGELSKRKGVKTNKYSAPFSPRNKLIFGNAEVIGSNSTIPYSKPTIEVKISGTSVFYGFAVIEEAQNSYSIQSYALASDFYTVINNSKLTDLDTTVFNHLWIEPNITASMFNIEGYIYAFVYNGRAGSGGSIVDQVPPDALLPNMFFHSVIKLIANQAGYTLVGDVLTNSRFLNHLILCNKFPLSIIFGEQFDLSQTLPDVTQSKLWLDFANIYGLQFDIDQQAGIIRCNYIDDLIFNDPEDWTNKIDSSEKPNISYSIGYGQKSYLKFNSDDDCTEDYSKEVLISDTTLDSEVDIYTSPFFMIQDLSFATSVMPDLGQTKTFIQKDNQNFQGAWIPGTTYSPLINQSVWHNGTYYKCKLSSTGNEPPNGTYWDAVELSTIWTIKNRPMYGYLVTDPSSIVSVLFSSGSEIITKVVQNTSLDWDTTYTNHYRVFSRIINKTKKVKQLVKLSYADINQIDFTKAKKINNELFIVEDITQFKLNRNDSTLVNFIRL